MAAIYQSQFGYAPYVNKTDAALKGFQQGMNMVGMGQGIYNSSPAGQDAMMDRLSKHKDLFQPVGTTTPTINMLNQSPGLYSTPNVTLSQEAKSVSIPPGLGQATLSPSSTPQITSIIK